MWDNETEKKKEIVTTGILKYDLRRIRLFRFRQVAFRLSLIILLLILGYWRMALAHTKWLVIGLFIGIPLVAICTVLLWHTVMLMRDLVSIQKEDFVIVQEKLIAAETKERSGRYSETHYYLHFSGYAPYQIPESCYTWSDVLHMSSSSVYNASLEGDIFHLVIVRGNITAAYNGQFFDFAL